MKKRGFHPSYLNLSISIILLIIIWVSSNMYWGDSRWHKLLKIDGVGYYSYLPAIFIYNDLNFDFVDQIKKDNSQAELDFSFRVKTDNGTTNKYFSGTAFCNLPFFFIAHQLTKATGGIADGYSFYYLIAIQLAAFFYLIAGLIALSQILKFYDISVKIRAIVLLAIFFGTNLFYYVVHEPFMSHVFSFAFVNFFVLSVCNYLKSLKSLKSKYLFYSAISLGLIFLIRPVNVMLVMAIPFLIGDFGKLKTVFSKLFKEPLKLIFAFFVFIAIISIQFIIYKIQTGSFIVYSYGNESLDFSKPHVVDFLFSYRKGFFVWAPLLFFSLLGMKFIFKKSRFQFISWNVFILIVVFVLSSWWNWYYGGSFGSRVMIDYYVFFAIPLALLLQKSKFRKSIITTVILISIFTQIQTFQYIKGYIHWSEMNKEWYWETFMRIDKVFDQAEKPWGEIDK